MNIAFKEWPKCGKCDKGVMLPIEDIPQNGSVAYLRAWVCNNSECGHNIIFKAGKIITEQIIKEKEL